MNSLVKKTLIIMLVLILLLPLFSCTKENSETVADVFLEHIVNEEFEAAYQHIWPYDNDSLEKQEFIDKYTVIFDALEITDIKISDILITEDSFGKFYNYTLSYVTKEYGTYTYDFEIKIKTAKGVDYIDWDQSLIFPSMEYQDRLYIETIYPTRGEIFDKNGKILAKNDYGTAVYIEAGKIKNILEVSKELSELIKTSEAKIYEVFNKCLSLNSSNGNSNIMILNTFPKDYFDEEQKEFILSFDGIGIDTKNYAPIRTYPYKEIISHSLGYMGPITEQQLLDNPDEGYTSDSYVGKTGLELAYEKELKGRNGLIIYIADRWGNMKEILYEEPVQQGQDLILTIDIDLQEKAYNTMKKSFKSHQSGVAIVMNASTGEVEAMSSYPSFDNNIFNFPVSEKTWSELTNASSKSPLYDRATKGLYPPGSLIKPFTIVPALESGKLNANSTFRESLDGNQWYPNIRNWNSPPISRVGGAAGWPIHLDDAMVYSDNIYFAWAAIKTGAEEMEAYLENAGFEQDIPFDVPIKKSNVINDTQEWYSRLLADVGYGQGQLLITPIQIASMYTAYANKTGNMMQPILVKQIKQTKGDKYILLENREATVYKNIISENTYNIISPLLKRVVSDGTARRLSGNSPTVAGKTGTAEVGFTKSNEIAWFAGYWIKGSYNRLVVVMVETKVGSGSVKFTVANELLEPDETIYYYSSDN